MKKLPADAGLPMTRSGTNPLVFSSVTWRAVRSSGPGGQNVNKVSTAVQLRFKPENSGLPERVTRRLRVIFPGRFSADGSIVIRAQEFRSLSLNHAAAMKRLAEMIRTAFREAPERIPTRPKRSAVERRLEAKSRRGAIKRMRSMPPGDQ